MNRIGVLTAGGDTPALNATLHGVVARANELRIEVFGLLKGYHSLLTNPIPYLRLNPLFQPIPELDPTYGGSILGSSRAYVDSNDQNVVNGIVKRLEKLSVNGLICIGGDGTLNAMGALAEHFPTVLAPKTIDNDLGLNYRSEPTEWKKKQQNGAYSRTRIVNHMNLDDMINYVTPGYATAVFVSAQGIQRIRTTAESHRRVAIIEVMGRQSGYLALGSAYGQPDLILVPEHPLRQEALVQKIKDIYDVQKNVVIVISEGIVDDAGTILGNMNPTKDPSGNIVYNGAAESLKQILVRDLGDEYFINQRQHDSASDAIFTRKVGHTQRGGRPILFDRFYASQLGGKSIDMLLEGWRNGIAVLQHTSEEGFVLDSIDANMLRDPWGEIHPRYMHASFYDVGRFQPSEIGIQYLKPIFSNAIGADDVETIRSQLFDPSHLTQPYSSVNVDIRKRTHYLELP